MAATITKIDDNITSIPTLQGRKMARFAELYNRHLIFLILSLYYTNSESYGYETKN